MNVLRALVPAAVAFSSSSSSSVLASSADCDFGPTHHSHLVLPLAANAEECKLANASFLLSHGATFFCPHTFDVKLLGHLAEEDARNTLCDTHFESVERGVSSKMVLRPTLPAGGLPALARGEMSSWESPVMYHVHNFGTYLLMIVVLLSLCVKDGGCCCWQWEWQYQWQWQWW